MHLGGSQPAPPPEAEWLGVNAVEIYRAYTGRTPLLPVPSRRALGSLLRPQPCLQPPRLRSAMLHLRNGSNAKIPWPPSVFFIHDLHRARLLFKSQRENNVGVKKKRKKKGPLKFLPRGPAAILIQFKGFGLSLIQLCLISIPVSQSLISAISETLRMDGFLPDWSYLRDGMKTFTFHVDGAGQAVLLLLFCFATYTYMLYISKTFPCATM